MIPGERRQPQIRVRCDGCRRLSLPTPGGALPDDWTTRAASRGTPAAKLCAACSADEQREGMLLLAKHDCDGGDGA